jgi:ornithine--oxo-acid transaminase
VSVRGRGLLAGIEITRASGSARSFAEKLLDRGVLCKDTHEQVIRLAPPLIVQKDQLDWLVEQLRFVLEKS